MKKCNFFSVLVLALFMFMSSSIFAQDKEVLKKAPAIVSNAIETLRTVPLAGPSSSTAPNNSNAGLLNRMKIKVGETILLELKNGLSVSSAVSNAVSSIKTGNSPQRIQLMKEVDLYYRNLLKL